MSASLASSRSKASPSIQDSSRHRPRGGLLVKVDTRTAGAPHSIQCLACRSFSSRTSPLTPYAGLQVVPRYRGVPARGDKCGANLGPFTVVMGFLWLHKHLTNRPNLRGFLPQIDSHGGSRRFESCCAHQLQPPHFKEVDCRWTWVDFLQTRAQLGQKPILGFADHLRNRRKGPPLEEGL
jgi:hypothetical protein